MKNKTAIIIGIYGQDGSYLAEFLIKKKYFVYGITNKIKKVDYFKKYKKNLKISKISINKFKSISKLIRH